MRQLIRLITAFIMLVLAGLLGLFAYGGFYTASLDQALGKPEELVQTSQMLGAWFVVAFIVALFAARNTWRKPTELKYKGINRAQAIIYTILILGALIFIGEKLSR